MYVNCYTPGTTFAVTGPWRRSRPATRLARRRSAGRRIEGPDRTGGRGSRRVSEKAAKGRTTKNGQPRAGDGLALRELLRGPGRRAVDLAAYDTGRPPAGPRDKAAGLAATPGWATASRTSRNACGRRARPATGGGCCWCCRAWTPAARAARSSTSSACSTRPAAGSRRSRHPPTRNCGHSFLWRIKRALPQPGEIGIFDRSHYEDVLIARVRELVSPRPSSTSRYGQINGFEKSLAEDGVTVVKCFLHISLRRAARPSARTPRQPRQALEVPASATSTTAPCGPRTRRRTRSHWSAARPTRALVPGPGGPQVVPQLGDQPTAAGAPGGARPAATRRRTSTWRRHAGGCSHSEPAYAGGMTENRARRGLVLAGDRAGGPRPPLTEDLDVDVRGDRRRHRRPEHGLGTGPAGTQRGACWRPTASPPGSPGTPRPR